ncbi:hypothetical protein EZS27_003454 [termite gut metagenome]|uniref:RagB/SusD family nutrient uptake outer membrane protein n=1 Tax=termite gut metagenome TaxID=433724 RepID=A0A5J4SUI3_9ZZZZ
MKNIISIFILTIFLIGCSGFLDEENKAGIINNDLYSTSEGYQTLRVNAYNKLRVIYNDTPWLLLAGTDLYQLPRATPSNGIYDYTSDLNATNGNVKSFYSNCYTVLQAINTAEYYLSIANISDSDKNLYRAEYNFMKGFVHFLLIEQFGGIVINDEYTQNPRMNMPRSTLEESYQYVIDKLDAALSGSLPATTKDGTINKDIVNHYLAKVYLTRGWDLNNNADFTKSKTYANAVITSRGGSLKYTMEELWSPTKENNDEVVFAIQYDAKSINSITSGNNQESLFGPYLGGSERKHKYMSTYLYPSWSLHSWFDKDDARYEATFMLTMWEFYYDYYQGKNVPGVNAITAVYPRAWDRSQEMFSDYSILAKGEANGIFNDVTMTENNNLLPGVKEFIKKWCPEFAAIDVNNIKNAVAAANGNNYLKVYPFFEHSADPKVNETYWRTGYNNDFVQPVIKKFDMDKSVSFSQTQSYRDIVLATLSETMLLYAEACIGEGNYPEAQNYINKVLARPGNSKSGTLLTTTLPTTSKEDALEVYLKESGKELAGQYCGRWPELRRTKMLEKMFIKYNYDHFILPSNPIGSKTYRPIPQDAIDINEALTNADQNPGY